MKNSQWLGILAGIVLIVACFLPWSFYPDIQKTFTGFFSENNVYGKPGKIFIFFTVIAAVFYSVPRVWAKRWNLFICAIILAYAVKCFILYSACYRGFCPEKIYGIYIMLGAAIVMMIASITPDLTVKESPKQL